jgi:hypothetical protein
MNICRPGEGKRSFVAVLLGQSFNRLLPGVNAVVESKRAENAIQTYCATGVKD